MPIEDTERKQNDNDDGMEDWKRVRSQIEHENTLINHRLSWLFSSQAFLFGAFIYILQLTVVRAQAVATAVEKGQVLMDVPKTQPALVGIAVVGILICCFILAMVDAAHKQIQMLENWWIHYYLKDKCLEYNDELFKIERLKGHPPINGLFDEWVYNILKTEWLPLPLIIGWLYLLYVVFESNLSICKVTIGGILAILALALIWKLFLKKKRARPDRGLKI